MADPHFSRSEIVRVAILPAAQRVPWTPQFTPFRAKIFSGFGSESSPPMLARDDRPGVHVSRRNAAWHVRSHADSATYTCSKSLGPVQAGKLWIMAEFV